MVTKHSIKIGARGSKLSMVQANFVAKILADLLRGCDELRGGDMGSSDNRINNKDRCCEIVPIKTTGDILYQIPLAEIGGKGLFLKEIEEQLLEGHIDIAVHSMKDVPATLPPGLKIGAVLKRVDPRDVLICPNKGSSEGHDVRMRSEHGIRVKQVDLREAEHKEEQGDGKVSSIIALPLLRQGAMIGTCSGRRKVFLQKIRPDLEIIAMRGNVDTRISKVDAGQFDGVVLAAAGLERLGLLNRISYTFNIDEMIPAVGQGAICIECRENDVMMIDLLTRIDCIKTRRCVEAERSFMFEVGGNCSVPLAAHAQFIVDNNSKHMDNHGDTTILSLNAMLYSNGEMLISSVKGDKNFGVELGKKAAAFIGFGK